MTTQDIKDIFKEIFQEEDGKVTSVETVFELSDNEEFYKLVISIHNISFKDTIIIHTKFIFKVDKNKLDLLNNSFIYLYDINCVYHKVNYSDREDLKSKINGIISSNDFGDDVQILSKFIETPAMLLNHYFNKNKIKDYSVFEVKYEPKFKTTPCYKTTFDFEINVNNTYTFNLTITKKDAENTEEVNEYKFHFKLLDEFKTLKVDSLKNIHYTIGGVISSMLDEKLK